MKDFEKLLESELDNLEHLNEALNVKSVLSDIKIQINKIFCKQDTQPHIVSKVSNLFQMVVAGKDLLKAIKTKKMLDVIEELSIRKTILDKTKTMVMDAVDDPKLRCDGEPAKIDAEKFRKEIDKVFKRNIDKISMKIDRLKKKLSK